MIMLSGLLCSLYSTILSKLLLSRLVVKNDFSLYCVYIHVRYEEIYEKITQRTGFEIEEFLLILDFSVTLYKHLNSRTGCISKNLVDNSRFLILEIIS